MYWITTVGVTQKCKYKLSMYMKDCVIGVDVGGTKLLANVYDTGGTSLLRIYRATGRNTCPIKLVEMIKEISEKCRSVGHVKAVGVGFPGLIDRRQRIVRSSVILDGWSNVNLEELVTASTDLPCFVDNDVNNSARAESMIRGKACGRDLLFVSVGTGIGGALVIDGKVWHGISGFAGEIGHVLIDANGPKCTCGRNGCVAVYASGVQIDRILKMKPDIQWTSTDDPRLWSILEKPAECLGIAIASVLNVMNLPLVVIGGGVSVVGVRLVSLVERTAKRHVFPEIAQDCSFQLACGGYDAGSLGAALLAGLLIQGNGNLSVGKNSPQ